MGSRKKLKFTVKTMEVDVNFIAALTTILLSIDLRVFKTDHWLLLFDKFTFIILFSSITTKYPLPICLTFYPLPIYDEKPYNFCCCMRFELRFSNDTQGKRGQYFDIQKET